MTDQELQTAIDSAREFLKIIGQTSGPLYEARGKTKLALYELEKIQVTRAAMAASPTLTNAHRGAAMSMIPNMMAPQGWQCQCCNRIYSPTTPMCFTCGGEAKTMPSTDTAPMTDPARGACTSCWGSGLTTAGWPCPCKKVNMFNTLAKDQS